MSIGQENLNVNHLKLITQPYLRSAVTWPFMQEKKMHHDITPNLSFMVMSEFILEGDFPFFRTHNESNFFFK